MKFGGERKMELSSVLNMLWGLTAVLGWICYLPVADAFHCYDCKSVATSPDDQCGDSFSRDRNNGYVSLCEGQTCVKLETEVPGQEAKHVERYCVDYTISKSCKTTSNGLAKNTICYCDSNVCNEGAPHTCTVMSLLTLMAFHIVKWLL